MSGMNAMIAECKKYVDEGYRAGPTDHTIFGAWYGLDYNPYCDEFVSYCGAASGNTAAIGHFAYCPSHVDWFRSRNQWSEYPKIGAIVFYDWDDDGIADHTGIVVSFDDDTITCYEGDTVGPNDGPYGVWERTRARKVPNVLGYGYPSYPADQAPPAAVPPAKPHVPAYPGPTFLPGCYSTSTTLLDHQLIHLGYAYAYHYGPGPYYGSGTEAAVYAFLAKHPDLWVNGKPDDICGPRTWDAIFSAG
ncbi:CHAP domain-containing protein [Streptacidiphilus albus]|uniref:CHAP domain-containing protein n=1 Tax=Streptacidiphilus albus TaxID=105425 RepID=UPI0006943A60|nr:CHAP domain-containing protein [Streptacidiphilus albus]